MNVQITEDYRIISDSTNGQFIVQRRHIVDPTKSPAFKDGMDPTKREVYKDRTYHARLEQAISEILRLELIHSDAHSLAEILDEIHSFKIHIDKLIYG